MVEIVCRLPCISDSG